MWRTVSGSIITLFPRKHQIKELFGLKEGGYSLTYIDEDGDAVSVDSQGGWIMGGMPSLNEWDDLYRNKQL